MTIESRGHEHEFEPQYGLPERLPSQERIVWQGSPNVAALARRAFHLPKLALYFGILMALRASAVIGDGGAVSDALSALVWPAMLSLIALATVAVLAWLTARTAVYTVTDRRVVMRIGIVLTLSFNLPFRYIESAALRTDDGNCGDIVLKLRGPDHISWLHLFPHARPWHLNHPEPMLRSIPDAQRVAALLTQAWSAATGVAVNRAAVVARPPAQTARPQMQPSLT